MVRQAFEGDRLHGWLKVGKIVVYLYLERLAGLGELGGKIAGKRALYAGRAQSVRIRVAVKRSLRARPSLLSSRRPVRQPGLGWKYLTTVPARSGCLNRRSRNTCRSTDRVRRPRRRKTQRRYPCSQPRKHRTDALVLAPLRNPRLPLPTDAIALPPRQGRFCLGKTSAPARCRPFWGQFGRGRVMPRFQAPTAAWSSRQG